MTSPKVSPHTDSGYRVDKTGRKIKNRQPLDQITGSAANLFNVLKQSLPIEREIGAGYYLEQKGHMLRRAYRSGLPIEHITGAFVVLSPNNSERMNYLALDICVQIAMGVLPESTKVPAYPLNKDKALRILRAPNSDPLHVVKGRKVTAFYHNTLWPQKDDHLTIDGHMFGAWQGKRIQLRGEGDIPAKLYEQICGDLRIAAKAGGFPTTSAQAIIWLTWKRLHNILPYNPQLSFDWDGDNYEHYDHAAELPSIAVRRHYLADQFRADLPAIL